MNIELDFAAVLTEWPLLIKGMAWTLGLTAVSAMLGVMLGVVCAWSRTQGPAWARPVVSAYVELIRNTPFLVQLFFFFFALPAIGLRWSPYTAALTAMVVNLGAYATEIIRAGVQAIHPAQLEAALAAAKEAVPPAEIERRALAALHARPPSPACRGATHRAADAGALSRPGDPVPQPLAPLRGRRHGPQAGARRAAGGRAQSQRRRAAAAAAPEGALEAAGRGEEATNLTRNLTAQRRSRRCSRRR